MRHQKIWIILVISISLLLTGVGSNEAAGKYGFLKQILKQSDNVLKKLAKETAPAVKKPLKSSELRKMLPDIPANKITPFAASIAALGKNFTDQGKYATKFINSVSKPDDVLRQFSKYGKGYVKTAQTAAKTLSKNLDTLILNSKKTGYKNLSPALSPGTLTSLKNPAFFNSKYVEVLKRTGKKGYKVLGEMAAWAKKNPKKTAAAIAFAWYLTDPEGFTEAVRAGGDSVADFLGSSLTAAGEGVGRGAVSGIWQNISWDNIWYFILGVFLVSIAFLRPVRRFVLIPFRYIGNKMDKMADNMERAGKIVKEQKVSNQTDFKPKTEMRSVEDLTQKGSSIFE